MAQLAFPECNFPSLYLIFIFCETKALYSTYNSADGISVSVTPKSFIFKNSQICNIYVE